jgi:hypothetical protein
MSMGASGMADMAEHLAHMKVPQNSIPMKGGQGPFGTIDMGGMVTVLKVREDIDSYEDPGWYDHPRSTVAWKVDENEVTAALGAGASAGASASATTRPSAVTYVCPMHPEVTSSEPGRCPKCGMNLVPKR